MELRTLTNVPGVSFDDTKTNVLFAEDYNELKDRVQKRIVAITSASTITPDVSLYDEYHLSSLSETLFVANFTGTPSDGASFIIRVTADGNTRSISFDSNYRASADLPFPTEVIADKTLYVGLKYNAMESKYDLLAVLGNL